MRRERLKDQIEDPRVSVFDTFVRAVVILISLGAVFYAFSGRGYPLARKIPSGADPAPAVASLVTLTVTRNHTVHWNDEGPISVTDANARLAAWLKTAPAPRVVIAADESARLGDAMELLNEARRLGISDVHLQTRPRPAP